MVPVRAEIPNSKNEKGQKGTWYYGGVFGEPYDELEKILPKLVRKENIEEGKNYTLEDNLKMRSGPNLSDEKLTTALKGTKAKILKCGRYEIIDGIYSRWVQVEFESGAKDKDGKSFDSKKSYWCFGGYLK